MTQGNKRIFFIAGGSGGHVIPALEVYKHFDQKRIDGYSFSSFFVTDERGEKFLHDKVKNVFVLKTVYANIRYLPIALFNAISLIKIFAKEKPHIIVCFGGVMTIIPSIIAWLFKIPIIIHEQNASMGKANRFILKHFATRALTSFNNTKNVCKPNLLNFTGLPIREDITQKKLIEDDGRISILIIAGSQGSDFFDEYLPKIIFKTIKNNPNLKDKITIYEQVRHDKFNEIENLYQNLGINFELKTFFKNINDYIQKSDLLISRSGASTIFEILSAKIPGLLIPMKNSAENHQYMNAIELSKIQAEIPLIEEHEVEKIENILLYVFTSKKLLISTQQELLKYETGSTMNNIEQNIIEVLNHANN